MKRIHHLITSMTTFFKPVLFLALATISFPHLSVGQEYVPDSSTVALWHFNELSSDTVNDASGNGNLGMAIGTAIADGKFVKARSFNGTSDRVTVPSSAELNVSPLLTLEAWIKPTAFSSGPNTFLRKNGPNSQNGYLMHFKNNGTVFDFGINTKFGLGTETPVDPSYFLDGRWHHVAGTYDGSIARVYFDGVLVDQDAFNETIGTNSTDPVSIGANDIYGEYFQGSIDEVRISNKVRQPWEFNVPGINGLVAYYPFTGDANDESGHGHNGTISGGVTLTTDRWGNPNHAYQFNGTNGIITAESLAVDVNDGEYNSVSFWMYWNGVDQDMPFSFNGVYDVAFYSSMFGFNTGNADMVGISPSGLAHRWVHVVASFVNGIPNTSSSELYIDGIKKSLSGSSSFYAMANSRITIGNWEGVEPHWFHGLIDDIRVYNRKLSQSEVDSLYHEGGWNGLLSGLIAYYPFNSNANDESGNGNNGTLYGATPTTDRFGNINSAYAFDGNGQYMNANFTPNSVFSISIWIKKSCQQNGNAGVLSTYSGGFFNFDGVYYAVAGPFEVIRYDGNSYYIISSSNTNWEHLAIVSDGTNVRVYENNWKKLDFIGTTNHSAVLVFGDSRYNGRYFTGSLDDIVVYNRALTELEIQALYHERNWPVFNVFPAIEGWNMISNPLIVTDNTKSFLFPTSSSSAFAYQGSYVRADSLKNGKGYWLKFPSAWDVSIPGEPVTQHTITVRNGWNMMGSISVHIAAASITSIPPRIRTSEFWGYCGSYSKTDTIFPGKAYWVKVNQDGKLILTSATGAVSAANRIRIVPTQELPPAAPDGDKVATVIPTEYALEQNYPNPFNPSTTIKYSLPVRSQLTLTVFDVLGRQVATLVDGAQDAGYHEIVWSGANNTGSGVYFYRLQAGSFVETKKFLLIK